jgi:hypothetical protein
VRQCTQPQRQRKLTRSVAADFAQLARHVALDGEVSERHNSYDQRGRTVPTENEPTPQRVHTLEPAPLANEPAGQSLQLCARVVFDTVPSGQNRHPAAGGRQHPRGPVWLIRLPWPAAFRYCPAWQSEHVCGPTDTPLLTEKRPVSHMRQRVRPVALAKKPESQAMQPAWPCAVLMVPMGQSIQLELPGVDW